MKRREPLGLDMTPVVDIVFILLIFFLVSSVFKKDELALLLDLPEAGSSKKVSKEKTVMIELSKNALALNGKKIEFKNLISTIKPLAQDGRMIMFHIDKDVPYSKVIRILNILQENSLNKLALITDDE